MQSENWTDSRVRGPKMSAFGAKLLTVFDLQHQRYLEVHMCGRKFSLRNSSRALLYPFETALSIQAAQRSIRQIHRDRCWSLLRISTLVVLNSMNLPNTQRSSNYPRRRRAVRTFTAFALITFLFTASAVQAGPIGIKQVVQTVNTIQGPTDLRLNNLVQDPSGPSKGSLPGGPRNDGPVNTQAGDGVKLDGLLGGFPTLQDPQKLGVEVIEQAEVEGTICDCGEILLPAGGIPKWPFLFLAAVPLVFIHDCDNCNDTPSSTPTPTPPANPTPTPQPTPEPASLLLFGTGLLAVGAGLRRRYTRSKVEQVKAATEEE